MKLREGFSCCAVRRVCLFRLSLEVWACELRVAGGEEGRGSVGVAGGFDADAEGLEPGRRHLVLAQA